MHATELEPQIAWLDERLRGGALQEVRCVVSDTVHLKVRQPGETIAVVLSVANGLGRVHTTDARPPRGRARPLAFQGLLRKELRGRVEGVEQLGGDRLVRIRVGPERSLVALLVPRRRDLLLLDGDDVVLGAARGTVSRGTTLALPPPGGGASPGDRFAGLDGAERDAAIRRHFDDVAVRRRTTDLRGRLKQRRKSVARTVEKRRREAARAADADALQQTGDLLQSAFGRLRRGLTSVDVHDFYAGGAPRTIELDPALTPQENVERWYRKARKARRAGEAAAARLEEAELEFLALEDARAALDRGDLDAVEAALPARRKTGGGRPASAGPRLPYLVYQAPDGTEIRVGRGARDNDALTFRHARGNDVWLHVRGRPGAHVVLRNPGAPSPPQLLAAAQLAAHHSGLKPGARVEVAWTRVKELRKPKGMAPGAVLVGREKVLYVEVDPDAIAALTRARE